MAKIIQTAELEPDKYSGSESLWIYNGLDCCVTEEVLQAMLGEADESALRTYTYSRSLQGPILEMNMRGLLVDQDRRQEVLKEYEKDIATLESNLDAMVREGIGITLNWRSNKDLQELLYNVMGIPPVKKRNSKGRMAPTVNRDALEKIECYFIAQPIAAHLLALRDIGKKVGVLRTQIDPDGRFRTNFNIAGTTTGRLASATSDFGTGSNAQNIEKKLRSVFVSDPGYKFVNIDLAQADARNIGALCWTAFAESHGEDYAGKYLNATESGDLHTTVTRMAWDNLPWPENPDDWRAIADQKGYRHLTYRDLAKKLGHASNYLVQPPTAAVHTKLPVQVCADFASRYFKSFPEIQDYHKHVEIELKTHGFLITPFDRRRYFLGRRNDPETLRQAVAHMGQSMTADEINQCMLNVWYLRMKTGADIQFMIQVHDSLVLQLPEDREEELIPKILEVFKRPLILKKDRYFCVPCDCQTGWNLDEVHKDGTNPDGLKGWKGSDSRKRERLPPMTLLERRFL